MVQDGLSAIQDVIIKVRESVKYVVASEMHINMFKEIAKQLESSSLDLVLDCCTKCEEEWEKVRVVCSFLEEFYDAVQLTQGTEYPTSNLFLIELVYLKQFLSETNKGEDTYMKDMVTKMKAKFDQYWTDSYLLLSVAAVLDPRNKMKFIEWGFQDFYCSADAVECRITVRVTTKSTFSAGSNVIDPHHASLGVDTVQVLLCAGDWLRARYGIQRTSEEMKAYQEINLT